MSLLHNTVLYCFSIWCMTLKSLQRWEPYCVHNIKITYFQHRFALNAWNTGTELITGTSQARRAALWSFRRWETVQIITILKLILLLASHSMIIQACKSGQRFVVLGRNNLPIEPQELESGKGLYRIPIIGMNREVDNICRLSLFSDLWSNCQVSLVSQALRCRPLRVSPHGTRTKTIMTLPCTFCRRE